MTFKFQINHDLKWNHDKKLLDKAEEFLPELNRLAVTPKAIVKVVEDINFINGYATREDEKNIDYLSNYSFGKDEKIVLDLGDHYVGRFSVDITSVGSPMDSPLYLKLKFAEIPAEICADAEEYDGWLSKSWIQEEYIHLDSLPATLELPRRYSCRYIELEVIDSSPKWKAVFNKPVFLSESSVALDQCTKRTIEDTFLKKIYDVSVKTLMDCMQTVFEDGPKRDRRLWLGDLRLQALANYYTFDDSLLVKRCLYLFGGMTTEEGKISANVFTSPDLIPDDTFLFDYSLFFSVTLYDYLTHRKDKEILTDLYPIAKKGMDLALEQVDTEGRLKLSEDWPVFVDWSNEFDKRTAAQGILIYSLKRFIHLAREMNDDQLKEYQFILDKMEVFVKNVLFDREEYQFIIEETHEMNIASQVWMVLAEVMDDPTNNKIMKRTIETQFPITGIATPYMYHHIVEALFVARERDEAVRLLKEYWGKMLDMGADTFWEAFKPENPDFSPYGSPIVNSYCHAWSCTPAYLIAKYLK